MKPEFKAALQRIRQKVRMTPNELKEEKPPDGITCEFCGNTGWVEIKENGNVVMGHCPYCYEQRQAARRLRLSGIDPRDYERYSLEAFDGTRSKMAQQMKCMALRWLNRHEEKGPGFGLFGKSGMGKSHICIGLCLKLTKNLHEPHYYFQYRTQMPKLVKAAQSYSDDYEETLKKWKELPNLYIDDLFKGSGKLRDGRLIDVDRNELQVVFDLINARYLNHVTTIFSSEYSLQDITNVDEAIGSRIYEMTYPYIIQVNGENQRLRRK